MNVTETTNVTDHHETEDILFEQQMIAEIMNGVDKGQLIHIENEYSSTGAYDHPYNVGDDVLIELETNTTEDEETRGTITDLKRDQYLVNSPCRLPTKSNVMINIHVFFIYFITKKVQIQGFGEEEIEEIRIFSLYIGIDFIKVSSAVIIMSTIGAITDVAISIASPMKEIAFHNPTMGKKELFISGMTIGRDILGSNTNTLFFAFIGGYMALLIWFKDLSYSFGEIVNSKIFSSEMIVILFAGIGIALIIPIMAWINAWYLVHQRTKAQ